MSTLAGDYSSTISKLVNLDTLFAIKLTDAKFLVPISFGAATIATILWFKPFYNVDRTFPELPNKHWLTGHMGFFNNSNGTGKMMQNLNKPTYHNMAYFRGHLFGGTDWLILFTYRDMKELFSSHGQESVGRSLGAQIHSGSDLNDAIIDTWGPVWKNNRKNFHNHLRSFGREKQIQLVLDEVKQLTDTLETMPEYFEPTSLLQSAVCNITSSLIFGFRFEYFDPEAQKIFRAILTGTVELILLPRIMVKILRLFLPKQSVDIFEAVETMKSFINEQINERLQTGERGSVETLIDAYTYESTKDGQQFDVKNLAAVIFELFFAGTRAPPQLFAGF